MGFIVCFYFHLLVVFHERNSFRVTFHHLSAHGVKKIVWLSCDYYMYQFADMLEK